MMKKSTATKSRNRSADEITQVQEVHDREVAAVLPVGPWRHTTWRRRPGSHHREHMGLRDHSRLLAA